MPDAPDEAKAFLHALDPGAERFTFQTYQDVARLAPVTKPALARVHHDDKCLHEYHAAGAGVWVCVNEIDLKGRKSENVVRVRAVWQEADGGYDGPFPLDPSIVVETSPGHHHRYWLTDWPADEVGRADHRAVMERMIASYGSDKNAKDITRVLRVPGYLHRKGSPFMVRIVAMPGHRYSREEILRAFPPLPRVIKPVSPARPMQTSDGDEIADALAVLPADDRDLWLGIGMALHAHLGEAGKDLWDRWSQTSTKYDAQDLDRVWRSFGGKKGVTINTLFFRARAAGWRKNEREVWSAAGRFIARSPLDPRGAWQTFQRWHERNPITTRARAEQIFESILDKELANGH